MVERSNVNANHATRVLHCVTVTIWSIYSSARSARSTLTTFDAVSTENLHALPLWIIWDVDIPCRVLESRAPFATSLCTVPQSGQDYGIWLFNTSLSFEWRRHHPWDASQRLVEKMHSVKNYSKVVTCCSRLCRDTYVLCLRIGTMGSPWIKYWRWFGMDGLRVVERWDWGGHGGLWGDWLTENGGGCGGRVLDSERGYNLWRLS